jgi:enamine deaminase RidA (YjgF/YER057c/UK114 family)
MTIVQPEGWPRPSGYANGVSAVGRVLAVSGQVGWDPATQQLVSEDLSEQARQALCNVASVLGAGNAGPRDVVRLTWYVTDREEYLAARKRIGQSYQEVFGNHFPAMSLVIVAGLLEPAAKVEIEATAVVPEP